MDKLNELTAELEALTLDVDSEMSKLAEKLSGGSRNSPSYADLIKLADKLRVKHFKDIVVMTGAGISVSAGIPDFRSPKTGLYSNLAKYDLPYPEAIFELDYFSEDPTAFYELAREIWPGTYHPTPTHFFIRHLHDMGVLKRNFTQNIDGLERIAGIGHDYLVEAHGTFSSAACISCRSSHEHDYVKVHAMAGNVPLCNVASCTGTVKPDIVFFGEDLPRRYYRQASVDLPSCDLLIIMGTSLQVAPFCRLVDDVGPDTIRVLINRECVGGIGERQSDIFLQGDCDDIIRDLTSLIGCRGELDALLDEYHSTINSSEDDTKQE